MLRNFISRGAEAATRCEKCQVVEFFLGKGNRNLPTLPKWLRARHPMPHVIYSYISLHNLALGSRICQPCGHKRIDSSGAGALKWKRRLPAKRNRRSVRYATPVLPLAGRTAVVVTDRFPFTKAATDVRMHVHGLPTVIERHDRITSIPGHAHPAPFRAAGSG